MASDWWLVVSERMLLEICILNDIDKEVSQIRSFKDLEVWKESIELALLIYRISSEFPKDERFSLTDQVRRAAISIPSNIAEGQARLHSKEFLYHLSIARGSLAELETQIILSQKLSYLNNENADIVHQQIIKVGKILNGLIRSLKK